MSATTPSPEDWVQRRYDEEEQLLRSAPGVVDSLVNCLKINAESYRRLYGEPVTLGSSTGPYTISLGGRSVAVQRVECRVVVETKVGQEQSTSELEIAFGPNRELQLRAASNLLSIEDASKHILTPILFPQAGAERSQGAAVGR